MSDTLQLSVAYMLMVASQRYGGAIIGLLHGDAARSAAETMSTDDVQTDLSFKEMCEGYESHHFNSVSNCLHAAGMIIGFILVFQASILAKAKQYRPSGRSYSTHLLICLAWLPPVWYLYAWAGHFFLQKDIPAVFSYGTTLRGWASGELCSVLALIQGRALTSPTEWLISAAMVALHLVVLPPALPLQMGVRSTLDSKRKGV